MKKIVAIIVFVFVYNLVYTQEHTKVIDSMRKYRNVPGLVYAVFSSDKLLDSGSVGNKKVKTKDPVRWKNRFQIGTATSVFNSFIAARMVKEGKISWNSTIGQVLPQLDGKIIKLYSKITLRQLLSQRVGLPEFMEQANYKEIHSLPGTPEQQRLTFVTMMLKRKPKLILDSITDASYSLVGMVVATTMLEKAAKKPWEKLVEEYISKPLKLDIQFGFPAAKDTSQPWGHWDNYYSLTSHKEDYWAQFFIPIAPAGNINISMPDYIIFAQQYLLALQKQKSFLDTDITKYLLFSQPFYSMGWANVKWEKFNIAFMSGRSPLYSSYIELIPEKNIGILVLCNSGTSDGRSVSMKIGHYLREYYTR
jgi:CubicO group peptidase (beta-lactamase class C family)